MHTLLTLFLNCPARTWEAQETVKTLFRRRIKVRIQAPKLDDAWPSEVPWAILKERLAQRTIKTKQGLRRAITEEWKKITPEKCEEIIAKFPEQIIKRKGNRLTGRRTQAF